MLILSGLLYAESTWAQPASPPPAVDASVFSADAFQTTDADKRPTGWSVTVAFDTNFDPNNDLGNLGPSHYSLIDIRERSFVPISEVRFVIIPGSTVNRIRLVIPSADAIDKDGVYHLYAFGLTFGGASLKATSQLQHTIKINLAPDQRGQVVPQVDETSTADIRPHAIPKAAWALKKSKGRDDSDLYGSYELTNVRGKATTGTGDLKVRIPFFKTFWHRTSRFSPVVDFKDSSDEGADPDSFKFAGEWFLPVYVGNNPNSHFPYTAVDWINSAKIEAPKNFDNINALWESRWLFPSSHLPWNTKNFRMFLDPFIGHELGKNVKNELKSAEGKGLARVMIGADLTIQIKMNLASLKGFEFNSSYIRRWPLKRELLVDKDADGNLVALMLSKGPKDYSDSKFVIKINDFFGPYIGYEWGRLPPNYELVDHKWTVGLLFKAKLRAGGD
jgi:hypothetical protein